MIAGKFMTQDTLPRAVLRDEADVGIDARTEIDDVSGKTAGCLMTPVMMALKGEVALIEEAARTVEEPRAEIARKERRAVLWKETAARLNLR
jgi:hypothetical protein